MKKGGGKQKGNQFERLVCRTLSLWWSGGERDDVFYRSQSSGGRATVRANRGITTINQYGDVSASDDDGLSFTRRVTVEIKRGYSNHTPYDFVDKLSSSGPTKFEEWFDQAESDRKKARAQYWWLITKRDRKQTMLFVKGWKPIDIATVYFPQQDVYGYLFEKFLDKVSSTNFIPGGLIPCSKNSP